MTSYRQDTLFRKRLVIFQTGLDSQSSEGIFRLSWTSKAGCRVFKSLTLGMV
jgi:hypothetical protein